MKKPVFGIFDKLMCTLVHLALEKKLHLLIIMIFISSPWALKEHVGSQSDMLSFQKKKCRTARDD